MESEATASEQPILGAQVLDVGAALATASQHQHGLHQHLAPVVQGQELAGGRNAL
ncbi:MAG TPA: hypothetical protein VK988_21585 [Acidimicrobiales bacterium]|nr:hypothetical protein [Acidimicrobiales bacterium]